MAYIQARNMTLYYPVFGSSSRSLKKTLVRAATGGRIAGDARGISICAIEDVLDQWTCFSSNHLFWEDSAGAMSFQKIKTRIRNTWIKKCHDRPRYIPPNIRYRPSKYRYRQAAKPFGESVS